ncbi:hypothetical protein MRX96_019325 [Rhipicephalus microplus]
MGFEQCARLVSPLRCDPCSAQRFAGLLSTMSGCSIVRRVRGDHDKNSSVGVCRVVVVGVFRYLKRKIYAVLWGLTLA